MGKLGDVLSHPGEFMPLVRMYRAAQRAAKLPQDPDLAFCYGMLNDVSRSFAIVIQQLPNPLRDAICVFYLVLRGLDTVEDDMALDVAFKVPELLRFHERIYDSAFCMDCGYKHYKRLMAQFGTVVRVFLGLEPGAQRVIADITRRMGEGMAEFIEKEVTTVADYDQYCHYVAGLVGIGLSQLFASSGLESDAMAGQEDLANHMGLFLQKTNIIRDYLVSGEVSADDPTLPATREAVASARALCGKQLQEWRLAHPRPPASTAALVRDFSALALSGAYFYHVWGLGGPDALFAPLRSYGWVLEQQRGLQQLVSALLLLVVFVATVVVRRPA
ncbi:Squalene synthase [Tetrabaena socialis]|uniref:Squalene synthase n=1 Tax=Tetrabaena socialis TaxID=47790 RepID=A0A2J8AAH9_9CHLO|nr:Squalene synthase [Tetrabaena socialis]|eukprot:PNH09521.1 Squalene synthase [Tetrabaena socialis]